MRLASAMRWALHKLLDSSLNFGESRPSSAFAVIFLLGFAVRLALLIVTDTWPDAENYELVHVAWSLARGGGFSDPFQSGTTGPTAHVAPVYPYLLAAIYKTFGLINFADLVKQVLACAISALIFAFLPAVAEAAGIARRAGFLGGVIGALTPMSIDVEVIGRWETHIATLLFVIALLYWLRHFRQKRLSWRQGTVSGLLWGLLLLTSPSFVTVFIALIMVTLIQSRPKRSALPYLVVVALVTAVVLTPWTVRNYRAFGKFVFVRDNAGLEFYLSNLPNAKRSMNDNLLAGGGKLHPFGSASSRHRIQEIGEVAFSRECMRKFIDNVKAQPANFAHRVGQRILWMWFPVGEHSLRDSMLPRDLVACMVTLFGLLGLYWLPVELEAKKFFSVALFSYPLVYYFVQTTMRYRLPIVWITCLLCANAVLVIAHKFAAPEFPEPYLSTRLSSMS